MTEASQPEKTKRSLEKTIEVSATPEQVWKALTDPKELVKWFPLEARVTPGVGGKFFISWGPDMEGEAEIIAWEPGKRIAWKESMATVEFTIEARGGKTLVRMVQSGFFSGEAWENEWFESTDYGWGFILLNLQWSLERHPGADRQVRWPRQKVDLTREETYARLLRSSSLFAGDLTTFKPGDSFALKTTTGENWTGKVEFIKPLRGFCLSIRELGDALLWVTIEGSPGTIEAQIWLAAFGLDENKLNNFQQQWSQRLSQILA
jgi:uncharacterized protein YndB with AHSA1/START domain